MPERSRKLTVLEGVDGGADDIAERLLLLMGDALLLGRLDCLDLRQLRGIVRTRRPGNGPVAQAHRGTHDDAVIGPALLAAAAQLDQRQRERAHELRDNGASLTDGLDCGTLLGHLGDDARQRVGGNDDERGDDDVKDVGGARVDHLERGIERGRGEHRPDARAPKRRHHDEERAVPSELRVDAVGNDTDERVDDGVDDL